MRKLKPLSAQEKRVMPWFGDKGDQTLRLDYDLDENSIVFDVGGYVGDWASNIFNKYVCRIFVFEPVPKYFEIIKRRFLKNRKVSIMNIGLDKESKMENITLSDDGTSLFKSGGDKLRVSMVRAIDFIVANGINRIDLIKINIEGGEYDLLEHLIETEYISRIRDIQVQFHDFMPNARPRMENIQKKLNETHYLTYQYEFVWENWRSRGTVREQ
jgi:FkbM family methyltransferase